MTASWRIIHFTPDPFVGARFALGAIVVEGGRVRVARAAHLPLACLNDRTLALTVQRLHARLDTLSDAGHLPPAFGPYATLTEPAFVPAGVKDPFAWVDAMLNPPRQSSKPAVPHGVQRATLGYRFFETWRVARFIHKTFRPEVNARGKFAEYGGLPQISHWAGGGSGVLLMEPVVPTRATFEHDLKELAPRLGAYQFALDQADELTSEVVVYITAGGSERRREEARDVLGPFAHAVIDTEDFSQRSAFLAKIRQFGAKGDEQAGLLSEV